MEIKFEMLAKRKNIYVAMEHADFIWDEHNVNKFIREYENGAQFNELCEMFGRNAEEVILLILDLVHNKMIKRKQIVLQ